MTRRLIDISQSLRPELPVWPGDTPFTEKRTWALGPNCPVNVSKFELSTHAGTHADAPLHYDAKGAPIAAVDLEVYVGPARVLDWRGRNDITPADLAPYLTDAPPRLLFRTFEVFPHTSWPHTWTTITPDAIDLMANAGMRLIGVDGPSLDAQESKTMDAHHAVRRHGMAILEGLVLDGVAPGDYELIALPLKLATLDASPVRAALRSLD
jgi:arylformamidase